MTGSNRRHPACKAGALPAELITRELTIISIHNNVLYVKAFFCTNQKVLLFIKNPQSMSYASLNQQVFISACKRQHIHRVGRRIPPLP